MTASGAEEDAGAAGPPPWSGPWADDARRLFQLVQTLAEQVGEEPAVALLRRAGPDVLDQVSEFAAGLAATLRATEPAGPATADHSNGPVNGPDADPAEGRTSAGTRPPSTVRIDVTD